MLAVKYIIVFLILVSIKHYVGFEESILTGLTWIAVDINRKR
jgi:hypothetical protein